LAGKPEGKGPVGRPRFRCEDNIKMIFRKWDGGAWTELIWLSIVTRAGNCKHCSELSGSIQCREFLD
jgi:hypothetical protein